MASIKRVALEFALGVSRELYPREFMGLLRGEKEHVKEILVVPATVWGDGFARVSGIHVPHDPTIIGSVHSHPSSSFRPSETDLMEFGRSGNVHLIIRYPYAGADDVACYDKDGNRTDFTVVH